jgi:hypothetical protein
VTLDRSKTATLESPHETSAGSVPPGRVPITARLAARTQMIFRVESAEAATALASVFGARDGNGVAAGADPIVERASSSSATPLPGDVRDRFESSLGADLSAVRVHTGSASAEAAAAVGARAYTTGQDIHFAEGQYAPADPFGLHLLAHEVAHTVQQAGGTPTTQHKLEVSTAGDAAEVEADRAADAMVTGAPAHVTTNVGLARKPAGASGLPSGYDNAHETDVDTAQEAAAHPDPKDVYQQPPINWDALAVAQPGPLAPGTWNQRPLVFLQPSAFLPGASQALPYVRPDGKATKPFSPVSGKKPPWYAKWLADTVAANACNQAFSGSYDAAVSQWNLVAPEVRAFNAAAKEAEAQGLFGVSSTGQFDAPVDSSADLDHYGDAQTVGPDDGKHAISSLFAAGGNQHNVDFSSVKKGQDLDTPLLAALVTAEENLMTAISNQRAWFINHCILKSKERQGLAAIDVVTAGKDQVQIEKERSDLNLAKARWGTAIDATTKVLTGLIDMGAALSKDKPDPYAFAKAAVSMTGTVAKAYSDLSFDTDLHDKDAAIVAIKNRILDKQSFIVGQAAIDAHMAVEADEVKLATLDTDTKQKLRARKTAYDAFAAAAGKNAHAHGATDVDAQRVEAAIRAIPIVETVLGRIQKARGLMDAPPYDARSGKGFRAAGQPQDFLLGVMHLRGYVAQFDAYEQKWQERLESLQKAATGLYSK